MLALLATPASALPQPQSTAAEPRPASIPAAPMGWNSWNSFANLIDAKIATEQAKALVDSGLKAAGYEYVVIDEGWWKGQRDREGNIVVDPQQWPALRPGQKAGDMSNLADYIHGLGLKAGIYTDAGKNGCGFAGPDIGPKYPGTGSEGYYDRDFLQFAKWGFDYVKVDWCGGADEKLAGAVQYAEVARAIRKAELETGHHLYLSICEWGSQKPWTWAPGVGGSTADIWRTGGDIVEPVVEAATDEKHLKRIVTLNNVLKAFDAGIHPEAQHTGYYNDLDMMVIGMRGMTEPWERVHMGLWTLSGAPLMIGADLTKLNRSSLAMLTSPDILAVHNDLLGVQAIKVAGVKPALEVWAKPLATSGKRAVVLLNRTESAATMSVKWSQLGLVTSAARVRDLFAARDLGPYDSAFSTPVPAGDLVMLVVSGQDRAPTLYSAVQAGNELAGGAVSEPCGSCPGGQSVTIGGKKSLAFKGVHSATPAFIRVIYRNTSKATVVARLAVNGSQTTAVAFPPTGEERRTLTLVLNMRDQEELY